MAPLHALAEAAGLQRHWHDVDGQEHIVPDATLETILAALGHKSGSDRQIANSIKALQREEAALAALIVADASMPINALEACNSAEIISADGTTFPLLQEDGVPIAPDAPGYYDCRIDGEATRLAVAPPHCPLPPAGERKPWGVSLQIPSLRGAQPSGFGDLGDLAQAVESLAAAGADAVAINPVHALFPGTGENFSPYSPSSRIHLNGAMAAPELVGHKPLPDDVQDNPLIDWPNALPARLSAMRAFFDGLTGAQRAQIIGEPDERQRLHAIFDTLDCHFRPNGAKGWRDWPTRYQNPQNKAVASFAAKHAAEVEFHAFVQAITRRSLAEVQARARAAGMTIGLVGDLAVGVDPGGSDGWALGDAMLRGLTIGAPPDPLGPHGQNWAITSFSPQGLRRSGYAPWIAMIRAALAHGGGLRIDHAFGLARLWVIPEGGGPADGAYLTYPFEDLMRLLTLEAHLANAFVIAEDLGTAPHDFSDAIARRRMLGMRVLWFERAQDNGFIGAQDYDPLATALSGTHDTQTLAGWWTGADLVWANRLRRLPQGMTLAEAQDIREWDRGLLWSTLAGDAPRPAADDPQALVDAGIAHIARTPSALAVITLEDLLGLIQQPNLPGTITEHPNWRRRLDAPLQDLLKTPEIQHRLALLQEHRG
ncbi:4-alpha-glucanotransferase [Erythrobacter sp. GH3-10]|uniref:4-alpha-glucanotransferase n=1 Tax=Aurantiacibacter rhizosphaerae TaxID=2691582 RepID=A0A844XGB7_9SPHN|nr:4-alpha-glucanotransferase [Aurantiacibacter rhizosphaerae]